VATASHTEVIARPIADVFRAFEDPEVIPQWQDNLLEFEQLKGSFNRKGGVAHMRIRQMGMENDVTTTVVDRKRPVFVKYHYEGAQAPFEILNRFRDLGDDTTEWTAELDLKLGLVFRALGPALKPIAKDLVKRNGRDFKAWCEANL